MKFDNIFTKKKIKGLGQVSILASILFLSIIFFRPTFKSQNDIKILTGHFKEYSFTSIGRGTSHLFWLKEYSNAFKISADFWSNKTFNQNEFYKLQYGDSVIVSIHKSEHNYFERNGDYFSIYSIKTPSTDILRIDNAVKIYNSNLILFGSLIFCLIGTVCLYFGYKKTKN